MKADFNEYAWDGEWFLQCTNDYGEKIGSKENSEGFIYLNPQIWAVISDITDDGRKRIAMKSVEKYLLKDYGALLLYPEYKTPHTEIGYITRYAAGLRENGGVYTHAGTWAVCNSDVPNSPNFGRGSWSWYSGSAQWLHSVAVRNILGVRPVKEGLEIKPCLPKAWTGYRYARTLRNAKYDITVKRTGRVKTVVDGKEINGNTIPYSDGIHTVVIEIK